jgi:hypothetical protein
MKLIIILSLFFLILTWCTNNPPIEEKEDLSGLIDIELMPINTGNFKEDIQQVNTYIEKNKNILEVNVNAINIKYEEKYSILLEEYSEWLNSWDINIRVETEKIVQEKEKNLFILQQKEIFKLEEKNQENIIKISETINITDLELYEVNSKNYINEKTKEIERNK